MKKPSMKRNVVLFLAANPSRRQRLALDREVRAIEMELRRARVQGFEFVTRWDVQPYDVRHDLHKLKPTVVHISSHGYQNGTCESPSVDAGDGLDHPTEAHRHGLVLQGHGGQAQIVSTAALNEAVAAAEGSVKLVMLNACYSDVRAEALLAHVDCVIRMSGTVHDDAAMNFAIGFYGSLGEGKSVAAAYKQGLAAVSTEGMRHGEGPQLSARDGVDVDQLVLAADHPASTRPIVETLLDALTLRSSPDELRPIAHFLGECVARRQVSTLARFHARARQLRRLSEPGSWHRGFADSLTAYLDGYFAEFEPTLQREKLVREVASHALWREILYTLRDDRALNQVAIGELIEARAPGVACSKSAISIALEDLRARELVEYVPGKTDRRERIHSLTMRGRELLSEPAMSSAMAHETSAGSIVDGSDTPPLQHPQDVVDTKIERSKRRAPTQSLPAEAGGSEATPSEGDRPRRRKLPSAPPAAGR
jgi:hypothetical protein